jgi:hypothetical protein
MNHIMRCFVFVLAFANSSPLLPFFSVREREPTAVPSTQPSAPTAFPTSLTQADDLGPLDDDFVGMDPVFTPPLVTGATYAPSPATTFGSTSALSVGDQTSTPTSVATWGSTPTIGYNFTLSPTSIDIRPNPLPSFNDNEYEVDVSLLVVYCYEKDSSC